MGIYCILNIVAHDFPVFCEASKPLLKDLSHHKFDNQHYDHSLILNYSIFNLLPLLEDLSSINLTNIQCNNFIIICRHFIFL